MHPSQPSATLALRPSLGAVRGLLALLVATSGCLRDMDELKPAPFPAEPAVFHDRVHQPCLRGDRVHLADR
ncbi:MAG: hypothetical protein OXG58_05100 [Gemmatimonadetes bacterium]|nr:hypothetical protein [Gemmatimonadota bacterium]